jgi:hypothetical protein
VPVHYVGSWNNSRPGGGAAMTHEQAEEMIRAIVRDEIDKALAKLIKRVNHLDWKLSQLREECASEGVCDYE